jgi:GNAT superfamily N-acetyltransferase
MATGEGPRKAAGMLTTTTTEVRVRDADPGDAEPCGRIFYDAFAAIANRHAFTVEPDSPEFTAFHARLMLSLEGIVGVVAEREGTVIGAAFADARGPVAGIGPVSVDPAHQDNGTGRRLMEALLERTRSAAGVRLIQTAYHARSLALYARLGFVVREPLSVLQGAPLRRSVPGLGVRPARPDDVPACDALCRRVHGHDRSGELRGAIAAGTAQVVERPDRISGYATGVGYGWHAVAEGNEDLQALIASAESFIGLGILVPSRNAALLSWCLDNGLRLVQQSTLMTMGLYNEPQGAWLPSIVY